MAEVKKLIEGYKKFYKDNFIDNKNDVFKNFKNSQNPKTLIICCSDSRVDPAILTNASMGDIFVIRNVANLVPGYQPEWDSSHGTSAAIEFAVNHLNVKHIVVLGHSNCGGIKALMDDEINIDKPFSFITNWVKIAKSIKENIPKDSKNKYECGEKEGIKLSLKNLTTFPWINEKILNNQIQLHGWYFSIEDASLSVLNQENDSFEKIEV